MNKKAYDEEHGRAPRKVLQARITWIAPWLRPTSSPACSTISSPEWCWGAVWTRPGLTRKQEALLNLAMLTALNRPHEIKLHVRGALNNGVTREEITGSLSSSSGVYATACPRPRRCLSRRQGSLRQPGPKIRLAIPLSQIPSNAKASGLLSRKFHLLTSCAALFCNDVRTEGVGSGRNLANVRNRWRHARTQDSRTK